MPQRHTRPAFSFLERCGLPYPRLFQMLFPLPLKPSFAVAPPCLPAKSCRCQPKPHFLRESLFDPPYQSRSTPFFFIYTVFFSFIIFLSLHKVHSVMSSFDGYLLVLPYESRNNFHLSILYSALSRMAQ